MHTKRIPGDKPQTVRQGTSTPQHFWRDDTARVNNRGSHSITCAYRVSAKPVPAATACTHRYSNTKGVRQQRGSRPFAHLPSTPRRVAVYFICTDPLTTTCTVVFPGWVAKVASLASLLAAKGMARISDCQALLFQALLLPLALTATSRRL